MPFNRRQSHHTTERTNHIPSKVNTVLNIMLAALLLIVVRIWHLAVLQNADKLEESSKPQHRIVIEAAKRGTIQDRFDIPLAINKVQYNAAILYSQLKRISGVIKEKDASGKIIKRFKRKEYIESLAQKLGIELKMDPDRIEDLIYAKASLYYQIPFTIKEDISEQEYYRLKMLEKDWPGIYVQRLPRRDYPRGKVAADIIGYMGAINKQEYDSILREISTLEEFLINWDSGEMISFPEGMRSIEDIENRLFELRERGYSIHDSIGKTGIERKFEEVLRGFHGQKNYYSDARGNFLRELPESKEPMPGQRLHLTISADLQEFAEHLLIQNERIREVRMSAVDVIKHTVIAQKHPWIKGGAIVVMDPNNGELLALASHPRFDPNDFIYSGNTEKNQKKNSSLFRWLENETYLASIWNQKRPLEREFYDVANEQVQEETLLMNWENYLNIVLAPNTPIRSSLHRLANLQNAVILQKSVEQLLHLSGQNNAYHLFNHLYQGGEHKPHGKKMLPHEFTNIDLHFQPHKDEVDALKQKIAPFFAGLPRNYDKVLLVDLVRLVADEKRYSEELLHLTGKQNLAFLKDVSGSLVSINEIAMNMARDLYHEYVFKKWRKKNEKEFLKKKRAEEKESKKYAKPYIDYIDALENQQFREFWNQYHLPFIIAFLTGEHPPYAEDQNGIDLAPFLHHFLAWGSEFARGAHSQIEWADAYHILKKGITHLTYPQAQEYLKALRNFHELNRPLLGKYPYLRKDKNSQQLEKHLAAAFYPKNGFGYGRSQAYRQATTQGSIFKLVTAYETLVQRYRKMGKKEATFLDLNPLEISEVLFHKGNESFVGYSADGHPLPRFYKGGRLPRSASSNLGKLDLLKAIETSSNPYFAILAGDILDKPDDLADAARLFSFGSKTGVTLSGEISGKIPEDLSRNRTGLYSFAIGQHTLVVTPLQTSVMLSAIGNGGKILKPQITLDDANIQARCKRCVFMPQVVRSILLEGMRRVVIRSQSESMRSLSRIYQDYPEAISDYVELQSQLLGKTSTSEAVENIDLDSQMGTNLYTHVWFGGISFEESTRGNFKQYLSKDQFGKAELVVVIYLRYGAFGKEAAPLAAQIVKKWREIKKQNASALLKTKL